MELLPLLFHSLPNSREIYACRIWMTDRLLPLLFGANIQLIFVGGSLVAYCHFFD